MIKKNPLHSADIVMTIYLFRLEESIYSINLQRINVYFRKTPTIKQKISRKR